MDLDGQLHGDLGIVYQFINSHVVESAEETEEMETETATVPAKTDVGSSKVKYCQCRNRDIPNQCTCGLPRDPSETKFDLRPGEPRRKINRVSDTLDVDAPYDPELNPRPSIGPIIAANDRPQRSSEIRGLPQDSEAEDSEDSDEDDDDDDDDDDEMRSIQEKNRIDPVVKFAAIRDNAGPLCYHPPEMAAKPTLVPNHVSEPIAALELLPFLPESPPGRYIPPILRWAAIYHRKPSDPPLRTPAQRRQQFQQNLVPVPYTKQTRGREYQARGIYEWGLCLG